MQEKYHDIKIGNKFFEGLEQFKYMVKTLIIQNSFHEEIKRGLESQCFLSFGEESSSLQS
jgi:hypothetical protein